MVYICKQQQQQQQQHQQQQQQVIIKSHLAEKEDAKKKINVCNRLLKRM